MRILSFGIIIYSGATVVLNGCGDRSTSNDGKSRSYSTTTNRDIKNEESLDIEVGGGSSTPIRIHEQIDPVMQSGVGQPGGARPPPVVQVPQPNPRFSFH